jgi:hypothetical protein
VKFEDGSIISVLKNRVTCPKNLQLGIEKFIKSEAVRPLNFKLRFFRQTRVRMSEQPEAEVELQ